MAIRFRDAETRPVTRSLAEEFQTMEEVQAERTKKPARLAQLQELIANGSLKCFNWAVAHLGARAIRVNGNHTSYLMSRPNVAIPEGATAVVEHYECDTLGDVVSLWGMFDATLSGRTKAEKLLTYAKSVPGLEDLANEPLSVVQSALVLDAVGTCQSLLTTDQKNALVASNVPFTRWYASIYKLDKRREFCKRAGVAYAALQMFRRDALKAFSFWEEVSSGANPNAQAGSRLLREYLLTEKKRKGFNKNGPNRMWEDTAKACIHCWNAWRRGETLKQIRRLQEMPKAI